MPTVVNGIGTWYYGKTHLHRLKGVCEFCNRVGELESYDTTLYFVVFFIPLLPLSRKRILQSCPSCQQHRVMSLKDWEEAKAKDTARVLDKLEEDPGNRDSVLAAVNLAIAYQDEVLFDKLSEGLGVKQDQDAVVQRRLGDAYSYFRRYPEAEHAYRHALTQQDERDLRQQLAIVLLKQGRPQEAEPLLRDILAERLRDDRGMIYLLIESYQAQGLHERALALINERDEAFPELIADPDCKKQRKTSAKLVGTQKRVASTFLDDSKKAGYEPGGWTSKLPRLIGPAVIAVLLAWYLGAAWYIGEHRKVYVVNGWSKPYKAAVNGVEYQLNPGIPTAIHVAEGDVTVESRDPQAPFIPVQCHIATGFWGRPFSNHMFLLNPDRMAIIMKETTEYSATPKPSPPPEFHLGEPYCAFQGISYEFEPFPETIKMKGGSVTKTRVGLLANPTPEARLLLTGRLMMDEKQRRAYAEDLLRMEPNSTWYLLVATAGRSPEETLTFLRSRLEEQPLLIEWHRTYQNLMEREHPEKDLRPEYEQLVTRSKGHPDAVYLLARIQPDLDAGEKLLRQAVAGPTPSAYAQFALGARALGQGRNDEALAFLEKAQTALPDNPNMQKHWRDTLLAAKQYDRLLAELQGEQHRPGLRRTALVKQVHIQAMRGDAEGANRKIEECLQTVNTEAPEERQKMRTMLDAMVACSRGDAKGYLEKVGSSPELYGFTAAFLQGKLDEAASMIRKDNAEDALEQQGVLYLAARKAGNKMLADTQLVALSEGLGKLGDREAKQVSQILAGKKPYDADYFYRLTVGPELKRVLLLVAAAQEIKEKEKLLGLARALDFQADETSLCLRQLSK